MPVRVAGNSIKILTVTSLPHEPRSTLRCLHVRDYPRASKRVACERYPFRYSKKLELAKEWDCLKRDLLEQLGNGARKGILIRIQRGEG